MPPETKQITLENFSKGRTKLLISTPVIEVGIDIPEADVMVIEGAERFGLAQLHQLRGRIGRANKQAYCFVALTQPTPSTLRRINFFCRNHDGFKLAEFDLMNRGPGEVYGIKQSGIPNLKIASISDLKMVKRVKAAVSAFINTYY